MNALLKKFYISGLILILFFIKPSFAGEFAVSPMMIELESVNRSTEEFSFTLFGKSNTNVKLSLFNMNQLESGYMGFTEATLEDINSIAHWITLDNERYRLRDGEAIQVNGRIKVPGKAAGTHLIAIMIEEDLPEEVKGGVRVKIRYAVIVNVRVEGRKGRVQSSFEEFVVVEKEDGLYLQASFTNKASTDEWLYSEVQLRDEANHLLERVELKTESSWERNDAGSRVFPNAKVFVYGRISKVFKTGHYRVLARNDFGGRTQAIYRDLIHLVAKEAEANKNQPRSSEGASLSSIEISSGSIDVEIRKNGTSFSSFTLRNNTAEVINIGLPDTLENPTDLGISDFQFYPKALTLRAYQSSKIVLKQNHINTADYGNIVYQARVETGDEFSSVSIFNIPTTLNQEH